MQANSSYYCEEFTNCRKVFRLLSVNKEGEVCEQFGCCFGLEMHLLLPLAEFLFISEPLGNFASAGRWSQYSA